MLHYGGIHETNEDNRIGETEDVLEDIKIDESKQLLDSAKNRKISGLYNFNLELVKYVGHLLKGKNNFNSSTTHGRNSKYKKTGI
jgi:hypothetical protein